MILLLETATKNCSVALMQEGSILAELNEASDGYVHAEKLHTSIDSLVRKQGGYKALKAICISKGPGSYTGLRIGVSAAKGLCFALDIPLLSIRTTESLAHYAISAKPGADRYIAMIDARRNEVYSEYFDSNGLSIQPVNAQIIDDPMLETITDHTVVVGDGAFKCRGKIKDEQILELLPSAAMMANGAIDKWLAQDFEDLAYFEPFYLKEFVPGLAKKIL